MWLADAAADSPTNIYGLLTSIVGALLVLATGSRLYTSRHKPGSTTDSTDTVDDREPVARHAVEATETLASDKLEAYLQRENAELKKEVAELRREAAEAKRMAEDARIAKHDLQSQMMLLQMMREQFLAERDQPRPRPHRDGGGSDA